MHWWPGAWRRCTCRGAATAYHDENRPTVTGVAFLVNSQLCCNNRKRTAWATGSPTVRHWFVTFSAPLPWLIACPSPCCPALPAPARPRC
ncbi:hypothetical protein CO2235_10391 [Cupriavidus oxalaticus]|uniref:Uncharacterized protein n=1 Tax=Cupriavidus oxalaticus TaxID=96344 RepID=A0A976B9C4_9BURK|nr:hypothetical protein CO2235_10391 [Cupriavidus oxalaticus]